MVSKIKPSEIFKKNETSLWGGFKNKALSWGDFKVKPSLLGGFKSETLLEDISEGTIMEDGFKSKNALKCFDNKIHSEVVLVVKPTARVVSKWTWRGGYGTHLGWAV